MLEPIMYNISKSMILIIIFFILIMVLGIISYFSTRKFNIHKKRVMFIGMLARLNKRQIIMLSSILIRTYLIIFCALYYSSNIFIYLLMIAIAEAVYIIFNIKKAIFETINTIAQIILLYIINVLVNYRIEIANEKFVMQIQIILSIFIIMYAIYFLFKNFEEIITIHKTVKDNKGEHYAQTTKTYKEKQEKK